MDDITALVEAAEHRKAREAARIRRWREGKRQTGSVFLTISLPETIKLYVEDTALKRHISPSALILETLTTPYHLSTDITVTATDTATDTVTDTATDTLQVRMLLQQELRAFFGESQQPQGITQRPYVIDPGNDTVTVTATDTSVQVSPVTGGAPDVPHVTDTVTDTSSPSERDDLESMPLIAPGRDPVTAPGDAPGTRFTPRGRTPRFREPILTLLRQYPDGLTAMELKVHLGTGASLDDTLQGMSKAKLIAKHGPRSKVRYTLPGTPQAPASA